MNISDTNHIRRINANNGMSLIEVIVWIAVVALLMSSMTLGILQIYSSNSYTLQRVVGVISARKGLNESVRLLRKATYSDTGAYPIVSFADNSVTFYVDKDNDNSAELVRLFLDGESLKVGVIEPAGIPATYTGTETINTLVNNVRNITLGVNLFTYYGSDGVEVIDQSAVLEPVFIEVELIANTGKNPTVDDYELKGSAFMRNLKN
jgi:type II secretory pathway pseudopilin PulG